MTSKNKTKTNKPTLKEKKELYNDLKKSYKNKSINLLKLKNKTEIKFKTDDCEYTLKVIDINNSIFFIQANDNFFKIKKKVKIIGAINNDNALRIATMCENEKLEILYKNKIVRTNTIKEIYFGH